MVKVTKSKIKILVADDHPVVRKGLQLCLAREPRLKIVGEAADGDEALRKTHELEPDVVLMDVNMPRMDGLAVTELLRKEAPAVKVLVLSMHTNQEFIFRIIQAGAHGYVSKEASPDELLRAIESVFIGEPFFSQDVARAALNQMVNSGGRKEPYAQAHRPRARGAGVDCRRPEQQGDCHETRHWCPHHRDPPRAHHAPARHPFGGRTHQICHRQRPGFA